MQRNVLLLVMLLLVTLAGLMMVGCGRKSDSGGADGEATAAPISVKIDAAEAKKMMEAGGVTVVDVRTPEEFAEGHVPGAINIANEMLTFDAEKILTDKDAVLLIYCRSGNRSAMAAKTLQKLGYTRIYDFGGIINWPYDVVRE